MMRKAMAVTTGVAFILIAAAWSVADMGWGGWERVRGSGDLEKETRPVSGIDGVELGTIGTLTIVIGDEERLTIEAEDNLLPYIETEVRRGMLRIDTESGISLRPRKRIRYHLTVKSLEEIAISSSGDVVAPDLEAKNFRITISSSGDLEMGILSCRKLDIDVSSSGDVFIEELNATTLSVSISSSGDVEIDDGRVDKQEITISSSGDFLARHLNSETAEVRISSSGDAHVRVEEFLRARTSSSGDVNYYGDPKVRSHESSSGDIRRAGR